MFLLKLLELSLDKLSPSTEFVEILANASRGFLSRLFSHL